MAAGDVRLSILESGTLWLDGGAMFGIVPKALWACQRRPDEHNRIELAMNVLLIEDGKRNVLVDTGCGTGWDDKSRKIYRLDSKSIETTLEPAGLSPDDIDLVVCSHLHFDHAGGNTIVDEAGRDAPAFPNARYVVQRGELETARWRNERTRGSYRVRDFEPLAREEGRLWLLEGNAAVTPHVSLRPAPGHTPHMQIALVESGDGNVAFLADLVPTASHVPFQYIMGYDLEPLVTLETKRRLLPEAAREGWRLVFEHDRDMPLATLSESDGRLVARAVSAEA